MVTYTLRERVTIDGHLIISDNWSDDLNRDLPALLHTQSSLTAHSSLTLARLSLAFILQNSHHYDFQITEGFRYPTITIFMTLADSRR